MSFPRQMEATLRHRALSRPIVTVTGPRQAGKTTLCRGTFPALPYANLERPDTREFAQTDPHGFLAQFPQGAVLDEVQRVPDLLSWLQVHVDQHPAAGPFILTGSHSFDLMNGISQSLAGRTALLHLLPLSINELRAVGVTINANALIIHGGYPRIHADKLNPSDTLADYFATFVERDLRQLAELRNLDDFRRFVRLAAGRVGQILNLQSLANDVGVSSHTAKSWMSLLEASYIVRLLPPWFANIGKRLIKAPKLYFCDTGLAAWLMGLTHADQVATHPLRGALFENLVVTEFFKHALNQGHHPRLHYFRDSNGLEVDLVVEDGMGPGELGLVEIKSGQTFQPDWLTPMHKVAALLPAPVNRRMLVFGGDGGYVRNGVEVVGLRS